MLPNSGSRQQGTCVAFGGTALAEYYWHAHGNSTKLSEEFLYEETKRIDGYPGTCGTWLVYAMRTLSSLGICPERVFGRTIQIFPATTTALNRETLGKMLLHSTRKGTCLIHTTR